MLIDLDVRFVSKGSSCLCRVVAILARPFMPFWMSRTWTTLGNTVYYPTSVSDPSLPGYRAIRSHEYMHVRQFRKYGLVLMGLAYLVLPLPFIFSGRWLIERGPYLRDILEGECEIGAVVDLLWGSYGWCWPKPLMRSWFEAQLRRHESLVSQPRRR